MAKGSYKVYYMEEELELDESHYDVLGIFIGEKAVSIEITADCSKLTTAVKRFSEGYKAAVADGVIPETLVKAFSRYHLETLVEDAREMGEPLENTFYGVAKYSDGRVDSVFAMEDDMGVYYIYLTLPYGMNGIVKDFPTVYVDSCTTETPDYSGDERLLKGYCEAAMKVAKANIKDLREEISELKADFDKKQAAVDELTGKKERGEYYYEPALLHAIDIAKTASDKLDAKKAELDEFKAALKKAKATLAEIGKPAAEVWTVDNDGSNDDPEEDEVPVVMVAEDSDEDDDLPDEYWIISEPAAAPKNLVEVEVLVTGGTENEMEDIYRYGVALKDDWGSLLEVDRDENETGVVVSFIGTAPETLIDDLRAYVSQTSATFDGTVKAAEEIMAAPIKKFEAVPAKKSAAAPVKKSKTAPTAKPRKMLKIEMTAYAPTCYQLDRLRTLLIQLDKKGKIDVDHGGWLDAEIAGDVAPLTFTARIPSSTYDIIADAAKYDNIALRGTINGKPVADGETENPILNTDADIAKARATVEKERAIFKIADAELNKLQMNFLAAVDELDACEIAAKRGAETAAAQLKKLETRYVEAKKALSAAHVRTSEARNALQRAEERLANCIRNKTSLYLESVA